MEQEPPSSAAVAVSKRYVAVEASFGADGTLTPRSVQWSDGRRFYVDAVVSCEPFGPESHGMRSKRFRVRVGRRTTDLFLEYAKAVLPYRKPERLRWWVYTGEKCDGSFDP